MIHPKRRLGIELLEDRFLPSSTASIGGLALENFNNPTELVHSTGSSNALVSTNSPGESEYNEPGTVTSTNTTSVISKSTGEDYNSTGTGTSPLTGTQTPSQDGEYENKTPENSPSPQSPTSQASYSEMDYPIQQNSTRIEGEGSATSTPVDSHAIASAIPNAILLPPIVLGPTASAPQAAGIALTAPPSPYSPNNEVAIPINGGIQEITLIDPGSSVSHPQDSSDYFTFPDFFAIRIDPAIVNQAIDKLLSGLDALIPDQVDQESLSVRLGYWVIAVSATAMSCELIRQDLRTRQKARAEIRLLNTPLPEDHR
jgi:hypothetical protein